MKEVAAEESASGGQLISLLGGRATQSLPALAVAAIAFPLGVRVVGVEIAPADLLSLGLLVHMVVTRRWRVLPRRVVSAVMASVFGMVVVSLVVATVTPSVSGYAALLSVGYYVKLLPLYLFIRTLDDSMARTVRRGVAMACLLLTVVLASAYLSSGLAATAIVFDDGGYVTGFAAGRWSWGPVRLFGAAQVNSYSALLVMVVAVAIDLRPRSLGVPMAVIATGLILASGSRGAIVALALLAVASTWAVGRRRAAAGPVLLLLVLVLVGFVTFDVAGRVSDLSPKYRDTIASVQAGDLSRFTSGRNELNRVMLEDIGRSPLVGTGFQDFRLYHPGSRFDTSSPHNQYLGALHKMGLGLGAVVILAFVRSGPRRWATQTGVVGATGPPLTIAVLAGMMPVFDPLTTTATATWIAMLWGSERP